MRTMRDNKRKAKYSTWGDALIQSELKGTYLTIIEMCGKQAEQHMCKNSEDFIIILFDIDVKSSFWYQM